MRADSGRVSHLLSACAESTVVDVQACQIVVFVCQIIKIGGKIGIQYPRKDNNSAVLKDKFEKIT